MRTESGPYPLRGREPPLGAPGHGAASEPDLPTLMDEFDLRRTIDVDQMGDLLWGRLAPSISSGRSRVRSSFAPGLSAVRGSAARGLGSSRS